ncbi:MAG: ATP-binding cassette domain-containing protein [Propionibacteriaceae bacterium]|jgi:D-methionine transport system ATP-binding protein|nr:ATP-binding cassette domain-containing protein [Propionibacteriaceae bacterium]
MTHAAPAPATAPNSDQPAPEIIRFDSVFKTFRTRHGEVEAVKDVSLTILQGEVFGVIGYSGAGKSTLVRLINALEKADSGRIEVNGQEVTSLGERELNRLRSGIGMIFQQFNLFSARTVIDNVAYPLKLNGKVKSAAARHARAMELLEFVGIEDKAHAYPSQLSGGQKQRVGIARALASSPGILLADEATSALDPETTRDVLDLLGRVNRELGVTVVIITHSMSVVQHICDKVAVMEDGAVVESGPTYQVFAHAKHPATRQFIATALKDKPREDTVARLRANYSGRLVLVTTGGSGLPLGAATQGLDVGAEIVFGSITEVEQQPFGSLTIAFTGPDVQIATALRRLEAAGATVAEIGEAP